MTGNPDSTRLRVAGSEIVLRAAEPEDRTRAREVQWAVGWKEPPTQHRSLPSKLHKFLPDSIKSSLKFRLFFFG